MTELIGIDREGLYRPAMSLTGRLRFEMPVWHLAHVQEPLGSYMMHPGFVPPSGLLNEAIAGDRKMGYDLLEKASDEACAYGINAKMHLDMAPAAAGLMNRSDDVEADLIAIGSHDRGPAASALLGSVGRALAIGSKRSFLIGRGDVAPTGGLSVVFATDFSYYAQRALDWLVDRKPEGICKITLVTAYDDKEWSNHGSFIELLQPSDEQTTLFEKLRNLSEKAVAMLQSKGFQANYNLKPGTINRCITRAMKEHSADLLMMGAQGHGFLERVLLGSTALHQVVAEPHSVMVIRP